MSKTGRINTLFQNKKDASCITVRGHSIAYEYSEGNNSLIFNQNIEVIIFPFQDVYQ